MAGEENGSNGSNSRVEDLILRQLERIEHKVDDALDDHGKRLGALEITVATIQTLMTRADSFWPRALPWLMFAWNILMVAVGGLLYLATHTPK